MSQSQATGPRRASSAMTNSALPPSASTWLFRIGATRSLATLGGLVRPDMFRVRGSVQVPGRGLIPGRPQWANKGRGRRCQPHGFVQARTTLRPHSESRSRSPSTSGRTKTRSTSSGSSPSSPVTVAAAVRMIMMLPRVKQQPGQIPPYGTLLSQTQESGPLGACRCSESQTLALKHSVGVHCWNAWLGEAPNFRYQGIRYQVYYDSEMLVAC